MKNHKIIRGDCRDYMWEMEDKSFDAIITDPLYDLDEATRQSFHREFVRLSRGAIIVFCPPENQWMPNPDQWLFWTKPISTKNTSRSYSRFVEIIQVWNGEVWNADRHWSQYTNVFSDLVDSKDHPFAKPLSLMIRLVKNHTNIGDKVLDPFMGSGKTGLACVSTQRHFTGIEINDNTFDIAEKSMRDYSL